ncbi:MAG TPA: tetratricopeptide repeat protein [Candidatus Wallbacteria bacterium]|nr:tetratricopeptide repeat protein [Candidatus Wallbacteria bacterium]
MKDNPGLHAGRKKLFFRAFYLLAIYFIITASFGYALATERITDDVSDSLDLINTQNFGKLNLVTSEVSVGLPPASSDPVAIEPLPEPRESNPYSKKNTLPKPQGTQVQPDQAHPGVKPPVTSVTSVKESLPAGVDVTRDRKTAEIDLMSKLVPDETFEVIGSSAATNPKAEEYFKTGTDQFNEKKYVEAKQNFDKALALEPKNDVYILALEMVLNTMKAQNITDPADDKKSKKNAVDPKKDDALAALEKRRNDETVKLDKELKELKKKKEVAVKYQRTNPGKNYKPRVKTQVFTCSFMGGQPVGNIIFNLGLNTEVKNSDIFGNYVWFDAEKDSMALAAVRLDCQPKKAILLITQKIFADDNNFVFPLTLKVNDVEAINGAFRLATDFRPYQFDITECLHYGFNQILFQTAPSLTSNYALLRIEIFIQNY